MIPPKTDKIWRILILGEKIYDLKSLPTKMLLMRIRLLARDQTSEKMTEAISIAHDFFSKNHLVLQDDINTIFGNKEENLK